MNKAFQKLASKIAKMEGKKKQVSIGNIREVLSCLTKLQANSIRKGHRTGTSPLVVLWELARKEVKKSK